jgi:hypothetical protein
MLADLGANFNLRNKLGLNPLDLAAFYFNPFFKSNSNYDYMVGFNNDNNNNDDDDNDNKNNNNADNDDKNNNNYNADNENMNNNKADDNINIINNNKLQIKTEEKIDIIKKEEIYIQKRNEIRKLLYTLQPRLRTLILYHEDCLEHTPRRPSDWEAPDRLLGFFSFLNFYLY